MRNDHDYYQDDDSGDDSGEFDFAELEERMRRAFQREITDIGTVHVFGCTLRCESDGEHESHTISVPAGDEHSARKKLLDELLPSGYSLVNATLIHTEPYVQ